MMTRQEALDFAKRRALAYVEAGDVEQAVASMGMDLRNSGHRELEDHFGCVIGVQQLLAGKMTLESCRRWIQGFN